MHTGGTDGMWKVSKGAVSSAWSTRKGGAVNPQLPQGMAMAPWKLYRLPQSHRPRSKQTFGEVRRPEQKQKANTLPETKFLVNTTSFLQSRPAKFKVMWI